MHVVSAASAALLDAANSTYCPNAGLTTLRRAIANDVYTARKKIPTTERQIIVTTGAMLSMHSLFCTLLNPGDEALLPLPGFPNYQQSVSLVGAVSVPYLCRPKDGYQPRIEEIKELMTKKTKVIVLCSPGNPTGAVLSPHLTQQIIQLASERGIFVISDEIYSDIVFDGTAFTSAAAFDPASIIDESRVAVVSGVSKGYAMTGFRVGWTRASPIIVEAMSKLQEPIVSCGTPFCQLAAVAALTGDQQGVRDMVTEYQKRRDAAISILIQRGHAPKDLVKPTGAFYLPLDITKSGLTSRDFALKLLQEERVAVAPGIAFDTTDNSSASQRRRREEETDMLNSFVRVSLANSLDNVSKGIHHICDLLDRC